MEKKRNLWIIPTDKPSRLYLTTKEYIFEKEYSSSTDECQNKHIYITNDEEIKEGDWFIEPINKSVLKLKDNADKLINSIFPTCKKIILTTDQDLIKDGVQEIGDEFLEWFVKNPSCESVQIYRSGNHYDGAMEFYHPLFYKIIIPKEETKQDFPMQKLIDIMENDEELRPKKETLEEACDNCNNDICCCTIRKQETFEEAAEKEFPLIDTEWCRTGACEEENLHLLGHRRSFIKGAKWQQEQNEMLLNEYNEYTVDCIEVDLKRPLPFKSWFKQNKKK